LSNVNGGQRFGLEGLLDLPPARAFLFRGHVRFAVGYPLADEHGPVAFQAKLAERIQERIAVEDAGTVLLIVFKEVSRAADVHVLAARSPKRCVKPRVEFVVDTKEFTDVVPFAGVAAVVVIDDRPARLAVALRETADQTVRFIADDTK